MNQKKALTYLLENISSEYNYLQYNAIAEWLQDCNWHTEAQIIWDRMIERFGDQKNFYIKELEILEKIHMVTHSGGYCVDYVKDLVERDPQLAEIREQYINGGTHFFYRLPEEDKLTDKKVFRIDREQVRQYDNSMFYSLFNRIFGWGMFTDQENGGWTSKDIKGEEFANELIALIEEEQND